MPYSYWSLGGVLISLPKAMSLRKAHGMYSIRVSSMYRIHGGCIMQKLLLQLIKPWSVHDQTEVVRYGGPSLIDLPR